MPVTKVKRFLVACTLTEHTPTNQQMCDDLKVILVDPERKVNRPGWLLSVDRVVVHDSVGRNG